VDSNTGEVFVNDYYLGAEQICSLGEGVCPDTSFKTNPGVDNVLVFNGNAEGGNTQIKYRRLLVTGDVNRDRTITDTLLNVVYAWNPSPVSDGQIQEHPAGHNFVTQINFFTGQEVGVVDLKLIHGSMMFAVWFGIFPWTSFMARWYKRFTWWWPVHWAVNGIALATMISAFGVGIAAAGTPQFPPSIPHTILGLTIVILAVFQPFTGWLANKLWSPERQGTPIFPDRVHGLLGWGIQIMAYANILLGLITYGASQGLIIAYGIVFGIIILFFILFAIFKFLQDQKNNKEH